MNEYIRYYHEDRTHLALDKETPGKRAEGPGNPGEAARIVACPDSADSTTAKT